MQFIPDESLEHLELEKILERLKAKCVSDEAKAYFSDPPFFINPRNIEDKLTEVTEIKELLILNEDLPFSFYEDVTTDLSWLRKEAYVLDIESIQRINQVIQLYNRIFIHLGKERDVKLKMITHIVQLCIPETQLVKLVAEVLTEEGEVKMDASVALVKIYREIQKKEREANRTFLQILNSFKSQGYLSDNVESVRQGRRVLSVPAEYKRKIRGLIVDESATGKTVFIEPEQMLWLNNAMAELEFEKRKEIQRILKQLCDRLRPFADHIALLYEKLVLLDIIRSKALFARDINGNKPYVSSSPCLKIRDGYHPLLYLKNRNIDIDTVKFDLWLKNENRIVVISGPNAGGKSITLKAVGLIQMLLQMGCLVPANENSQIGIFKKICTDIGDQQSVEDDLSTYSSRLKNMQSFVSNANPDTLILIDEFGSGTDPKIGGAIAEALLDDLNRKDVFGVITTHYSNLKMFAFKNRGILNAAMFFDEDELRPTYELQVGKPGSSFAFEIAAKAGLHPSIIKYAKNRAGKHAKAVDQLLVDLQRDKRDVEELLSAVKEKEIRAEKLIKSYEQMYGELEYRRKRIKLEKKQWEIQYQENAKKKLETSLRDIQKEKNESKLKEQIVDAALQKSTLVKEINKLEKDVYYSKEFNIQDFKKGDFVKLRKGNVTGQILSIDKKNAILLIGELRMNVKLKDLLPSSEPIETNPRRNVNTLLKNDKSGTHTKLDIRGYRKEDAVRSIEEFIDQALVGNQSILEIVHGKGNGVLRKTVKEKVAEYKEVKKILHPEAEKGGEGVTIIRL